MTTTKEALEKARDALESIRVCTSNRLYEHDGAPNSLWYRAGLCEIRDLARSYLTAIEAALSAGEVGAEALPETPTPEFLEPFARKWCVAHGIDPDEPSPPHGEWPRWYDECGAFAAMYSDMRAAMFAAAPPAPADDIPALLAEIARLREERGELDEEIELAGEIAAKLASLLDESAVILRGSPPPSTRYGYADVPARVREMKARAKRAEKAQEDLARAVMEEIEPTMGERMKCVRLSRAFLASLDNGGGDAPHRRIDNRIDYDDDGTLDEVVTDGGCHLERMDKDRWFLNAIRADGSEFCIWFKGNVTMTEERPAREETDDA